MTTVSDFKGRVYRVEDVKAAFTTLICLETDARITLPSQGWEQFGFNTVKPQEQAA